MRYLRAFRFPTAEEEWDVIYNDKKRVYSSWYPFGVLSRRGLCEVTFEPITVLYGGNGSGKTTALNLMAEKLHARRDSLYNRSAMYGRCLDLCRADMAMDAPRAIRIITSDDVFDFMLQLRTTKEGIEREREEAYSAWQELRSEHLQMRSMQDWDQLRRVVDARRHTMSRFARDEVGMNLIGHSNGESAWNYFTSKIEEGSLCFLDEPENSLSPLRQQELATYLEENARFFDTQLVIATHSPFLLAMRGAKIYDLDAEPPDVKKWTELENVKAYRRFFEQHRAAFEDETSSHSTHAADEL